MPLPSRCSFDASWDSNCKRTRVDPWFATWGRVCRYSSPSGKEGLASSWGISRSNQERTWWVLANGTWDYSEVIPREDLMKRKEPFNIGRLMTILSVKHWESPSLRKLKARIVFRGDDIRDGDGNLAVLLESKVNPAGISAINANWHSDRCWTTKLLSQMSYVHTFNQHWVQKFQRLSSCPQS